MTERPGEDEGLGAASETSSRFSMPRAGQFRLSILIPVYNERHLVETSIRRVLELQDPLISSLELIVVDDRSTDGSWDVLQRLAAEDSRIVLLRHERNKGKGAALQTALAQATGDISIVHDADLEYHPGDIPALLVPFAREGADAVFGSRYLSASYRRALMYRHTLINKTLTALSNWFTNLDLTDVETCYKAVNTTLLRSIPIRSNDFRFEIELAFKLAKRRARIFEVPIRYLPRTQEEGKKIKPKDGVLALMAMIRFSVLDDLYQDDEYGSRMLVELEKARRYHLWMGDRLRRFIGDRVLEIGAGIGSVTNQYIPRTQYVAADTNPHYIQYLHSYSFGKPYLQVRYLDVSNPEHFVGLQERFDTALMVNVLEHVEDEATALRNLFDALESGGRAVVLVPQGPALFGSMDEAMDHRRRYTSQGLRDALEKSGFRVEHVEDFNRSSVPGWWLNGKLLKRRNVARWQIKALEVLMPLLRRIDGWLPWKGLSVIAVGVKP